MRKRKILATILKTIGACIVLATFTMVVQGVFEQHEADKRVLDISDDVTSQISVQQDTEDYTPDYILDPTMDMPEIIVDGVAYIGAISFPTLNQSLPIASGWSYANLNGSPCRYTGSAYTNDLVIAGHNYTNHFGRMSSLSIGSPVQFTDAVGNQFQYEVVHSETVEPAAVESMVESEYDLTLFTCNLSGQARIAVRCMKVESN